MPVVYLNIFQHRFTSFFFCYFYFSSIFLSFFVSGLVTERVIRSVQVEILYKNLVPRRDLLMLCTWMNIFASLIFEFNQLFMLNV